MVVEVQSDKPAAILEATLDLIAERGFHNTPVSQIARRSGVSAGIIYHYFENKDDLIMALYRQVKADFACAITAGDPLALPFPEYLERIWLNAYHYYAGHPQETLFLEQFENSPYQTAVDEAQYDDTMRALLALVDRGIAEGQIRPMSPGVLQDFTLNVAMSLARRTIREGQTFSERELADYARACLRAVAA